MSQTLEERKQKRVQAIIPSEWWPKIDKYIHKKGYLSTSELVRDLIRKYVVEGDD